MRKLDNFVKYTEELRKLITENPDLPIAVIVDPEVCGDDSMWWYAPDVRFDIGEILNCEQDVNDEKVFTDRIDFEETLADIMADDSHYAVLNDDDFQKAVDEKLEEYEPYWTKVIQIKATI